jgi:hypothetical protein
MANTDVTSSHPTGATLPPSPSPSAVALGTTGGPPLRIRHLQPQPVVSHVYQTIAEVNESFEKLTQHLGALQQFNFFPADNLTAWLNIVLHLQAQANSLLLECLDSREMNNAAYYDGLCMEWERQLKDPDDVLIEAERRKQEVAAERELAAEEEEQQ